MLSATGAFGQPYTVWQDDPGVIGRTFRRSSLWRSSSVLALCTAAALWLGTNRSVAQCQPDNPAAGGAVVCAGNDNDGFVAPANTPVKITVEPNATVNGSGGGSAITFATGTSGNVLTNNGSLNSSVTGGNASITNNGNFNGGVMLTGTGDNSVTLNPGRNLNGLANLIGAGNTIDNSAVFNQGLILNGTVFNTVTNKAGAQINQTFSITGSGQNTVSNSGTVNNGLTLNGNGTNLITNAAGAQINGTFSITGNGQNTVSNSGTVNNGLTLNGNGTNLITNTTGGKINQNVESIGSAKDTVDNAGLINNSILLHEGDDIVINRTGASVNLELRGREVVNGIIDTGPGLDQLFMLGGNVNNQVLLGPDNDIGEISGGNITQFVRGEAGDDDVLWNGGLIGGLDMGSGADLATFRNLTSTNLKEIQVDGGASTSPALVEKDRLLWENTKGERVGRYIQWETFDLTMGSELTFTSTLTLGDANTGTGALSIDSTSTVFAGNGIHSIVSSVPAELVSVTNAGTIDLTNGPLRDNDSLRIVGNYTGQDGLLRLNTVLAFDNSPSDKLIIDKGAADGTTGLDILNNNGAGAQTVADGILVIEALNGATSSTGAFSLAEPAVAGPYEYFLFRGSKDGTTAPDNWYLRSELIPPPPPPPGPPEPPPPPPPGPPEST